jgi:uncharacterized protein YqeY
MSLIQQITDDMKLFMREKNQIGLSTVRMLKSEIKYAEIEKKESLTDDEVIKVIQSAIKKRKDAAEQYANAGRKELADKELAEIEILKKYMPEQLSEEELKKIIKDVINEVGADSPKQFGVVMKTVMSKVQGRADGKIVSKLVKEVF